MRPPCTAGRESLWYPNACADAADGLEAPRIPHGRARTRKRRLSSATRTASSHSPRARPDSLAAAGKSWIAEQRCEAKAVLLSCALLLVQGCRVLRSRAAERLQKYNVLELCAPSQAAFGRSSKVEYSRPGVFPVDCSRAFPKDRVFPCARAQNSTTLQKKANESARGSSLSSRCTRYRGSSLALPRARAIVCEVFAERLQSLCAVVRFNSF